MEEGWCGGRAGVRRGGSISAVLMKACSLLSGGVVMTSEKQQEQLTESCSAETGWLQPQVRAEPPVHSFLFCYFWYPLVMRITELHT